MNTYVQRAEETLKYKKDVDAETLENLLNNGLYLQSKDNNKNNLRVRKYIKEHFPDLEDRVVFQVDKRQGIVKIEKIKTQLDIQNEQLEKIQYDNDLRLAAERKFKEEKFYKRIKTFNGVNKLIDSIQKHLAKDNIDAEIRFSNSYFKTISFYVEYYTNNNDLKIIKVSDHFTESQRLEHPNEFFVDLKHCVSYQDVYAQIKNEINRNMTKEKI